MRVELPWPPKECGRNFQRQHHWRKYHGPVRHYRALCAWMVIQAKAKGLLTRIEFYPPNLRSDDDNMRSAAKSARDGIADALGVNDKLFRPVEVMCDPDRPKGKLIVTIKEA